jgi:tetratricopeptide (TPR) repeat protein
MRLSLGMVVVLACAGGAARADDVTVAREHYERGTTLYDLQRYAEAAHEYELAFEAKHAAALLFNIGQAYRLAGDLPKAIGAYRSYLRRTPGAPNRAEVEARIGEMQQVLDEQKRSQERPPVGTLPPDKVAPAVEPAPAASPAPGAAAPAPPAAAAAPEAVAQPEPGSLSAAAPVAAPAAADERPARARKMEIAGLAAAAVGVAFIATGAAFGALAHSAYDELNSPAPGYKFDVSTQNRMSTDQVVEGVFLGVGIAAVVAGATVAIFGYREARAARAARVSLAPSFERSSVGATFAARF